MLTLTKTQIKLAEKLADQNGLSYKMMMENAGTMSYEYLNSKIGVRNKKCVILAGNGNNAGDGFVMARLFCNDKIDVTIIMCMGEPKTDLSIENYKRLKNFDINIININDNIDNAKAEISSANIIIDAIFGTGFHGDLTDPVSDVLRTVNITNAKRVALDIPSGINADSGEFAKNCFNADITLTFATYKYAQLNTPSTEKCGVVEVLDIGIPSSIIYTVSNHVTKLSKEMIIDILPIRKSNSNKGDFGKLLNISGSLTMGGAAMMSTLSAMRIGAGIVRLATPTSVAKMIAPHLMEAMTFPLQETQDGSISVKSIDNISDLMNKSSACLIGCGLSVTDKTIQVVEHVIKTSNCNIIIDADALNCIAKNVDVLKSAKHTPIITPHIGEMARLVDMSIQDVIDNSVNIARVFAKEYKCIVVLKSYKTLIATPNGEIFVNTTGNAGLAKGGSGDVLAGMIAGLVAQGISLRDAALCGVYLHGSLADSLADRMSQYSMLARDIINEIPYVLKKLDR